MAFRGHALIISVSKYKHYNDLGTAVVNDGNDLADALRDPDLCGYDPAKVTVLRDKEVTSRSVFDALESIAAVAHEDDPVLFYFSGHGDEMPLGRDQGAGLLAYDFDENTMGGLISSQELSNRWSNLRSRRKLMLLDCCHAGGIEVLKASKAPPKGLSAVTLESLAEGRGNVVLASSRHEEPSAILPGDRNSLFTKHLINGFRGAAGHDPDGFVRVFELFNFVAVNVRRERPVQNPALSAKLVEDNFPVAFCASPTLRKKSPLLDGISPDFGLLETLSVLAPNLYPLGPLDGNVWERAGGDISRLQLDDTGRNSWFRAFKLLRQGGGGEKVSADTLAHEFRTDYPRHPALYKN
ncbi:MAG: caspase family protein [Rhodospirillales bacterium]